jgi:hypothetical protein
MVTAPHKAPEGADDVLVPEWAKEQIDSFCDFFDWDHTSEQSKALAQALLSAHERGVKEERERLKRLVHREHCKLSCHPVCVSLQLLSPVEGEQEGGK